MMNKFWKWYDTQTTRVQMTIVGVGIFALIYLTFGLVVGFAL